MEPSLGEVTLLLHQLQSGDRTAEERLMDIVYKELKRLARSYLRKEGKDHSLQPTALVHEAYLRLTRMTKTDWQSRSHFYGIAAKQMRNILVDHARTHLAEKRGQGLAFVSFDEAFVPAPMRAEEMIALDEALDRLARLDPRQCRIVELRFLSGLTEKETGEVLGMSTKTVQRDWISAKAWLFRELRSPINK